MATRFRFGRPITSTMRFKHPFDDSLNSAPDAKLFLRPAYLVVSRVINSMRVSLKLLTFYTASQQIFFMNL